MHSLKFISLLVGCALLIGYTPAQTSAHAPMEYAQRTPREAPCPDSRFTCITLQVPLDHFDPNNPETIEVVFGILRARKNQRKGMFVTATGGPVHRAC